MLSLNLKRISDAIIIGIPFVILFLWFYFKVYQFQYLNENYMDGLATLQLSRGWLEGRPLLYDTYHGFHYFQHNYYFILLTGFVTKWCGIYGLFLVYLGLLALFLFQWNRWLRKNNPAHGLNEWLAVSLLAVGSVAYHIFLDYIGWHPEQYFLPLLCLLALSLATRQWYQALVWGLLTFLVKETSVILIWGLLFFGSVLTMTLKKPDLSWEKYFFNKKNLLLTVCCLALFVLCLWWLSYLNGDQPSRLNRIFDNIRAKNSGNKLIYYTLLIGLFSGITILFGTLPFLSWLRVIPKPQIIFGALISVCIVLCIVFFIEGIYYFPSVGSGLRAPPRIGSFWAFITGSYVFFSVKLTKAKVSPPATQREWALWGGILQFVFHPILVSNNDLYYGDMSDITKNARFITEYKLGTQPYPTGSLHLLHELAEKLPPGAELMCVPQYMNVFQRVYPTMWHRGDWHKEKLSMLGRPLLYIYEKQKIGKAKDYFFPKQGYRSISNNELLILADTAWYNRHYK
ncbi:MAG: hypothetical protein U0X91_17510 [Spirosomataceae bacterium]